MPRTTAKTFRLTPPGHPEHVASGGGPQARGEADEVTTEDPSEDRSGQPGDHPVLDDEQVATANAAGMEALPGGVQKTPVTNSPSHPSNPQDKQSAGGQAAERRHQDH